MEDSSIFTVYNAAAGAGKTYTLVRAYLSKLLMAEKHNGYRNILAITFTNKAVAEMKTRVVSNLHAFSLPVTPNKFLPMLEELSTITKLEVLFLKEKSKSVLYSIMHNYAAFDIVTIDTFTHRIIRTFAHDLELSLNFEVEEDGELLLSEAVDALIARVGKDKKLTKLVLDFSLQKLDEDKSWDIGRDFLDIAKLLLKENDYLPLQRIQQKTLLDFENLRFTIFETMAITKKSIAEKSRILLALFESKNLIFSDFKSSYLPKHFEALMLGKPINFKAGWRENITTTDFYAKKLDPEKMELIDALRPQIEIVFTETKALYFKLKLLTLMRKGAVPLAVLGAIQTALFSIKKERNVLLIAEFNNIINKAIRDQPAPFIYERLGERYQHYFVDEFQDTSRLQWENLIPLIDNVLSGEAQDGNKGSLTIVGDAKQAIYRWRGGMAGQFIGLSNAANPFSTPHKQVLNLPTNYRSYDQIIRFNNDFFSFLSNDFKDEAHQLLYQQGNKQKVNAKTGGYVNISFIEAANTVEEFEVYPEKVHEYIQKIIQNGFLLKDICVLVRKRKQGVAIANYLTQHDIPIISSETLLVANAIEVQLIVQLLAVHVKPLNSNVKTDLLISLAFYYKIANKHAFIARYLNASLSKLSEGLQDFDVNFDFKILKLLPLYESVERIIASFAFNKGNVAYLQAFLDIIFKFSQQNGISILSFLEFWEQRKERLSIVVPSGENAVQILTIHKSKGLEFPVVILPFANEDIYKELQPKTWYQVEKENFNGFEEVYIDYSEVMESFSEKGAQLVSERRSQLELDSINMLYVALTRAEEQLYVISKKELNSKGATVNKKYSGKIIGFLQQKELWTPDLNEYHFGQAGRFSSHENNNDSRLVKSCNSFISVPKEAHNIYMVTNASKLWDTAQQEAIDKGSLIHDLLATILYAEDVKPVLLQAFRSGFIDFEMHNELSSLFTSLVNHPELAQYYSKDYTVLNERDVLSNGTLFRPDRVVLGQNEVVIIDYKTGIYKKSYQEQLNVYAAIYDRMGYKIKGKILLFLYPKLQLQYV